jgi:NIF3 (NGG1p interacting factor 3) protein
MHANQKVPKCCFAGCFALLALGTVSAAQDKHIIAREVISRIQARVGVPWQTETVDTFKAGNPDETVTGIAVTMMATMDVLERAAASGKNLVITHEPTFYNHLDKLDVLQEKREGSGTWRKARVYRGAPPRGLEIPRSLAPPHPGWY